MEKFKDAKRVWETEYWRNAILECNGNISAMARVSGLYRADIYTKLRQLGLGVPKGNDTIYFIKDEHGRVKIGKTTGTGIQRLRALQTGSGSALSLIATTKGSEKDIHARFANLRIKGEWFKLDAELSAFITRL